ncbi:MAG TPA: ABC transporter substrate-binding protein [Ilumatobacteraceae bacterium]|nr:ABC transporter substrate-binding protein [Ilumatobacteraceae bacterium]HRB03975.1 ABC transporter substrate-binding protein [Ilumatobacteraceae bacterium]
MTDQNKLWLPGAIGRRQLLVGAGAATVLVACGGDDKPSAATTANSTGTTTGATTATGDTTATTAATATTVAAAAGKKGGTLRVGVVGSTNDLIDGQYIVARADQARLITGWESIANYDDDFNIAYNNSLAEEIEAKAPDLYVVRLKAGVEFHNGKTVSAEDLVYSFKRLTDPALGIAPALSEFVDANSFKILDDLTVQITLLKPSVAFLYGLADYGATIVPVDYARFAGDPTTQIGTGAFKLKSFTPGSESVHVRHENYWGESYLDEVQIIDFSDQAAIVNALTSGDIDVAIDLPFAQAAAVESNGDLSLLESEAGNWQTITMRVDVAPFDDVRVRQAMRLIVNREEMVQRVLSGHGRVGNDMYGVLDGSYPKDFAQREQDIDAAKALLKDAGQENLSVELFAPDDTAGLPEYITAFAEQAKAAGVNVTATVLDGGTYWGAEYTQRAFATSYWSTRPYLNQVAQGSLPTATYPETHWPPADSDFVDLYNEAVGEVDADKRNGIIREMQQEEYDDGGNIIAYFQNLLDGYSVNVKGAVARPNLLNFDHFGRGWKNIWLES